jgi:hypothetical protein
MMLGHIEDKRRKLLLLEKSLLNALCAAFDPSRSALGPARVTGSIIAVPNTLELASSSKVVLSRTGSSSTHWKGQRSSMATGD